MGHTDPLHPWRITQTHLPITVITTPAQLSSAMDNANKKIIMLDFYADWCVSCKIMDNTILNQADVQTLLTNIVLLRIDVTRNTTDSQQLQKQFHVFAPPTFIFLDQNGKEIPNSRIIGEISHNAFIARIKTVESN